MKGGIYIRVIIKLDKLLSERNISQQKFSKMTGIRQPSINEMCRNITTRLPLANLARICEILKCDIPDVLEIDKSNPRD